jgi:hypothetical protein
MVQEEIMTHLLVTQVHFARSEFLRCLAGVSAEDAVRRLEPMNSISWIVGHLANHENYWWVLLAQGQEVIPGLNDLVGYGKPASTPPLAEMWAAWHAATLAADVYLETLTPDVLLTHLVWEGKPRPESIGTMLLRTMYHYWFHIGEAHAIRQMLGQQDLPQFVGDMSKVAYHLEN